MKDETETKTNRESNIVNSIHNQLNNVFVYMHI